MAESKLEQWMEKTANKYGVNKDLVKGLYYGLQHRRFRLSRRQQTEEFLDLYFKGVNDVEDDSNTDTSDIRPDGYAIDNGSR